MGLVALPGMMTGVMIGGISPAAAIKYQIAIMIAILSGTSLAATLAVYFSLRKSLTPWGSLNRSVFTRLNQ
jgi:putative ABC transport system permease protein